MLIFYLHILPDAARKKEEEKKRKETKCIKHISNILTSPTCEDEEEEGEKKKTSPLKVHKIQLNEYKKRKIVKEEKKNRVTER